MGRRRSRKGRAGAVDVVLLCANSEWVVGSVMRKGSSGVFARKGHSVGGDVGMCWEGTGAGTAGFMGGEREGRNRRSSDGGSGRAYVPRGVKLK